MAHFFKKKYVIICIPIDNANNLVFWCCFLSKLEPWMGTITKHSNINLIDRHQFPWLTETTESKPVKLETSC